MGDKERDLVCRVKCPHAKPNGQRPCGTKYQRGAAPCSERLRDVTSAMMLDPNIISVGLHVKREDEIHVFQRVRVGKLTFNLRQNFDIVSGRIVPRKIS